jgi:hypothetical protein
MVRWARLSRIREHHHQLLMPAAKHRGQRIITGFEHDAFSHPLPDLGLEVPNCLWSRQITNVLFRFLFFSCPTSALSLFARPANTLVPFACPSAAVILSVEMGAQRTPQGSLSCEAAASCQKLSVGSPSPWSTPLIDHDGAGLRSALSQ